MLEKLCCMIVCHCCCDTARNNLTLVLDAFYTLRTSQDKPSQFLWLSLKAAVWHPWTPLNPEEKMPNAFSTTLLPLISCSLLSYLPWWDLSWGRASSDKSWGQSIIPHDVVGNIWTFFNDWGFWKANGAILYLKWCTRLNPRSSGVTCCDLGLQCPQATVTQSEDTVTQSQQARFLITS